MPCVSCKCTLQVGETFERRRYFSVVTQWARHPELQEYIHTAITSLHDRILQGTVKKVALIFKDGKRGQPLERLIFTFDVNQPQDVRDLPYTEIEYLLQAHVTKLSAAGPILHPVEADCSWEIVAYSDTLPGTVSPQSRVWIPADCCDFERPPTLYPVKSVRSRHLKLQLYVEQPSM